MKKNKNNNLKVAVVCDPQYKKGGAELHLGYILKAFPSAELFTPYYDKEFTDKEYPGRKINHSFLQYLPGRTKFKYFQLLFHPWAYRSFRLKGYDVVISHTISFAKFVRVPKGIKHICSCMSPPKFLWDRKARSIRGAEEFTGLNKFLFKFYSFFMDTFFRRSLEEVG